MEGKIWKNDECYERKETKMERGGTGERSHKKGDKRKKLEKMET